MPRPLPRTRWRQHGKRCRLTALAYKPVTIRRGSTPPTNRHEPRVGSDPVRQRLIPAVLAISSFLVTFTILSWQHARWPFAKPPTHAGEAAVRPVPATSHERPTLARPSLRPMRVKSSTGPAPSLAAPKAITLARTADPAVGEESSATPVEPAITPVGSAEYFAERDRESLHSARAH